MFNASIPLMWQRQSEGPVQVLHWHRVQCIFEVAFAKEPYKRDCILQKRPIIVRSVLIAATPCGYCATSQGSLDRFEVDLSARPASSVRLIGVSSIFVISDALFECNAFSTSGTLRATQWKRRLSEVSCCVQRIHTCDGATSERRPCRSATSCATHF